MDTPIKTICFIECHKHIKLVDSKISYIFDKKVVLFIHLPVNLVIITKGYLNKNTVLRYW